ncbi:hypothetical protein K7X08_023707 [Anisodus acutangulus]|uniref:Uncharacterized protein n=1 Tax=Anisodus acutangulus TaxID=402998 RepID=A0A9Q1LAK3_9SOLA|nr:hypothetical protein K7X08_023707 [Anisodus acutangulus]
MNDPFICILLARTDWPDLFISWVHEKLMWLNHKTMQQLLMLLYMLLVDAHDRACILDREVLADLCRSFFVAVSRSITYQTEGAKVCLCCAESPLICTILRLLASIFR